MRYRLSVTRAAESDLDKLPPPVHRRIERSLDILREYPRHRNVRKLRGQDGYRLRVGDYRVLFTIDDTNGVISVFAVAHRREAYR